MWPVFTPREQMRVSRPAAEPHPFGFPIVIRPDLTQVETSDIKTHVFPAGRSPGGAVASAHPECERFPVVSLRKGCVPGQGRWNNFLPLWAPKSWGCCL